MLRRPKAVGTFTMIYRAEGPYVRYEVERLALPTSRLGHTEAVPQPIR